jgi:hypothetical protein
MREGLARLHLSLSAQTAAEQIANKHVDSPFNRPALDYVTPQCQFHSEKQSRFLAFQEIRTISSSLS